MQESEKRDKLLNVEQVRDRLQCSRRHVYYLIADGSLSALKIGVNKGIRVKASELERYLTTCDVV